MSKLRNKSEFNIDAAEFLIDKNYYAPSVHCSYYSCFQLLKYTINHFCGLEYEVLASNISISKKGSHQYVIDYMTNELRGVAGAVESRKFKRNITDLKHFRQESDYDNIEVNIDKGTTALRMAKDIRNYLITNFRV